MRKLLRMLLLCAVAGASSTCATVKPSDDVLQTAERVTLEVKNNNWLDVDIYVVHDGQRSRILNVTATNSASILIPSHMLGQVREIRLLAHTIGQPVTYSSETVYVGRGATMLWTLETDLTRSSLSIW